jgi:hypothetical protein
VTTGHGPKSATITAAEGTYIVLVERFQRTVSWRAAARGS